ncbi:MAG: ATP synthase F0 subunit C [Pseudomonadota bacterium]
MEFYLQDWVPMASYIGAGLAMGFGAIGSAVGEGYTASEATVAISRNPKISDDILKMMLMGQAVAESASIFGLVIAMMLLFSKFPHQTWITVSVLIASGISMGLGAIGSGIGSGITAGSACKGLARQPGFKDSIQMNMLVGSSVAQTPAIFSLVTSLILIFSDFSSHPVSPTWAAILGAGFAAGFGAVGSGLGDGLVAGAACEGTARQPLAAKTTLSTMFLGMAVTETTAIYGLLVSFILIFREVPATEALAPAMALLAAGLCMGIGAIGPGIGEGFTARSAVTWIARNENHTADITRVMLVGQAVSESTGIYSLVIALVLIFVV